PPLCQRPRAVRSFHVVPARSRRKPAERGRDRRRVRLRCRGSRGRVHGPPGGAGPGDRAGVRHRGQLVGAVPVRPRRLRDQRQLRVDLGGEGQHQRRRPVHAGAVRRTHLADRPVRVRHSRAGDGEGGSGPLRRVRPGRGAADRLRRDQPQHPGRPGGGGVRGDQEGPAAGGVRRGCRARPGAGAGHAGRDPDDPGDRPLGLQRLLRSVVAGRGGPVRRGEDPPVRPGRELIMSALQSARTRTSRRDLIAYAFIAPAVVVLALVVGIPALTTLGFSFTDVTFLRPTEFVGLRNYLTLIGDPVFGQALGNTLYYTVGVTVPSMALGLGTALLLNVRYPGRNVFRAILYLPV